MVLPLLVFLLGYASVYSDVILKDEEAQEILNEMQLSKKELESAKIELKNVQNQLTEQEKLRNELEVIYNEQKTSYEEQLTEAEKTKNISTTVACSTGSIAVVLTIILVIIML